MSKLSVETFQDFAIKYGTDMFQVIVRQAMAMPDNRDIQAMLDEALADLRTSLKNEVTQ